MLGNGPEQETTLRLQARKSFALGLFIQSRNGTPFDITDAIITMVVRKNVRSTDVNDSNNLIVNSTARLAAPIAGLARFELQANDLDFPAGIYQYTITMLYQGYSTVLVNGELELEQNTEFNSTTSTYDPLDTSSSALEVVLHNQHVIKVATGPTLAPGQAVFTHDMERRLLEIYAGAVLRGQLFTADDIGDGVNKVMMTTAERIKLANFIVTWESVQNKPEFGDIITHNEAEFIKKLQASGNDITSGVVNKDRLPIVMALRGATFGTDVPTGGPAGGLHFQYDE